MINKNPAMQKTLSQNNESSPHSETTLSLDHSIMDGIHSCDDILSMVYVQHSSCAASYLA